MSRFNLIREIKNLAFEDIRVGMEARFTRAFTEGDIQTFAALSGDYNPLHTDRAYAQTTIFKQPILHGMLLGSLFSTIVGMFLPGKRALYLSQTLSFKEAVKIGETVEVVGTVINIFPSIEVIELKTEIYAKGKVVIDGIAKVKVRK